MPSQPWFGRSPLLSPALTSAVARSPLPRLLYRLRRAWQAVTRPLTVGVRAIVADGQGRVLLVRHVYTDGWHLPGGRVAKGETAAEAAARELVEETGIIAYVPTLLGLYGRFSHGGSDHVAVYAFKWWEGEIRTDGLEIGEAAFFAPDALPADTALATQRRIAEYRGIAATADRW